MKLIAAILIMLAWQHARESVGANAGHGPHPMQPQGPLLYVADSMYFRDTIGPFAFDSATHHLGNILPGQNITLTKYYRYVGNTSVTIERGWAQDDMISICQYPREPLTKGAVYSFQVCCSFQLQRGLFSKQVGFQLSNGQSIPIRIDGNILPQ